MSNFSHLDGITVVAPSSRPATVLIMGDTPSHFTVPLNESMLKQYDIVIQGGTGNISLGGDGQDGDLILYPRSAEKSWSVNAFRQTATVHLDGDQANLWLGGNGVDGDIVLFSKSATDLNDTRQATIWLDGDRANLSMGGNGTDGDILLFPRNATKNSDASQASIWLDGDRGDIKLTNADCAEEFDLMDDSTVASPGSVMVLAGEGGNLSVSEKAYDHRVAGIVSGAGDYRPGIVLDRKDTQSPRCPIALVGKVHCNVEADTASIAVGDLLTTSNVAGHAMKAVDRNRAFGAIIGKALQNVESGSACIPVMVSLQ